MGTYQIRKVRDAQKPGISLGSSYKNVGYDCGCRQPLLFQGYSVVQTARRASPSIPYAGNDKIAMAMQFGHYFRFRGQGSRVLLNIQHIGELELFIKYPGDGSKNHIRVGFRVVQQTQPLAPQVPDMLEGIDQGVRGLRIGLDEEYISGSTDPRLVESVLAGIRVLEGLGAVIVTIKMPDTSGYLEAWAALCASEAVAAHEATYPSRRDDYGPWFQGWLDMGAAVTGAQYAKANNGRLGCRGLLNNIFGDIDVIGCPTMTTPAFPVTLEEMYGATFLQELPDWGRFTVPFDFSGAPTISLPCGQTSDGLPLSIQFVGKHLSEPMLCRVGYTFEQNTNWHDLRPDIA